MAGPRPAPANAAWYGPLVTWLLWPGVTLLVVSSLTSFILTVVSSARRRRAEGAGVAVRARFDWRFAAGLAVLAAALTVACYVFFDINPLMGLFAVALSFLLAIVACRVTGETGITPIGALGKVTQLTFGFFAPGQMAANLMTANVTGGAAGQSADLMTDLRTGLEVGATPRLQIIAQSFGILVGSVVGTLVYLFLIPDPAHMLITPQWPAPAVATWKAVAEGLAHGLSSLPTSAVTAIAIAAPIGFALALAERVLPRTLCPAGAERAGHRPCLRHSGVEFDLAVPRRGDRGGVRALLAAPGRALHLAGGGRAGGGRKPDGHRHHRHPCLLEVSVLKVVPEVGTHLSPSPSATRAPP